MKFNILHKMFDNPIKSVIAVILFILGCYCFFATLYTVEEGHEGIIKRFGEAVDQVGPGLHMKVPYMDTVEPMEIRTRKNVETMASATSEQMIVKVKVSVNWTVDKTSALDLYKQYGGLDQFESRILDPKFRSATKDAIPQYTAEALNMNRSVAIDLIEEKLRTAMTGFPVTISSVQIEDIGLPPKYVTSIETKQTEKNLADAEEHKLAKQAFTAQQAVNIAQAKADGIDVVAKAEANSIKIKGLAEAAAIKAKAAALRGNPLLVQLTHEQQWNGSKATTIIGGGTMPIVNLPGAM